MNLLDPVQCYFDAWNRHDPAQIVLLLAPDGVYRDPAVPEGLHGQAVGDYARQLIDLIADLRFEMISLAATSEHSGAVQWLMHGNSKAGPIALPGADFIEVAGDHIRSIRGYFDQRTLSEQLGDDNWSHRVTSGRLSRPGAFSLTWIELNPQEKELAGSYGMRIGTEMMETPGTLTKLTAGVGRRWFTITAWENMEHVTEMRRTNQAHKEAMHAFFNTDFGRAVHTSVWVPHRIGPIWVRCPECKKVVDYHRAGGKCPQGHVLPEQPAYW